MTLVNGCAVAGRAHGNIVAMNRIANRNRIGNLP
jgi:hypothetical protein